MRAAGLHASEQSAALRVARSVVVAIILAAFVCLISGLIWSVPAWCQITAEHNRKGVADPTLSKAAEGGDVTAMERLGLLLFQQDPKVGLQWLQKAAKAGSARSALVLGIALFNGDGIPKNQSEGFAWIELAHVRGELAARKTLDQVLPLLSGEELAKGRQRRSELSKVVPQRSGYAAARPKQTATNRALENGASPRRKSSSVQVVNVQLGSFGSQSSAKAAWAQMSRRYDALSKHAPTYIPFRAFTRLRITSLGAEQGAALCASLRRQGQACLLLR